MYPINWDCDCPSVREIQDAREGVLYACRDCDNHYVHHDGFGWNVIGSDEEWRNLTDHYTAVRYRRHGFYV